MILTSRREIISDALNQLQVDGSEIATVGAMIRDETEGSLAMDGAELEKRAALLQALTTRAMVTLTRVIGVAERLRTVAETTEPERPS